MDKVALHGFASLVFRSERDTTKKPKPRLYLATTQFTKKKRMLMRILTHAIVLISALAHQGGLDLTSHRSNSGFRDGSGAARASACWRIWGVYHHYMCIAMRAVLLMPGEGSDGRDDIYDAYLLPV